MDKEKCGGSASVILSGDSVISSGVEKSIFINALCSWVPPEDNPSASPKLEWAEPNFRRRLSQLTKMTVQVVHDLLAFAEEHNSLSEQKGIEGAGFNNPVISSEVEKSTLSQTKIVFSSLRGEIDREFKINQSLIEENEVLPAPFSLSTFNVPVAQATIALGLKGGYTAVYPAGNGIQREGAFYEAVLAAASSVLSGREGQVIFVYADENLLDYYKEVSARDGIQNQPLAFAALLSSQKEKNSIECNLNSVPKSPKAFLDFFTR